VKLDWKPDKLKKAVVADLVANAELVGQFLQSDARRRLLAYPDIPPRRAQGTEPRPYVGGRAYREYVAGLIGNEVIADPKGVTIIVGVRPGKSGRHHGLYIELGSRASAPRPFLRPAVFENADKIVVMLAGA